MNENGGVAATSLFVEIIVIGSGATLAILIAGYATAPDAVIKDLGKLPSGLLVVFSTSFIYLSGIIVDRAADKILRSKKDFLRTKYCGPKEEYEKIRDWISSHPNYSAFSGYARSRMRVCRGWSVNSILITLSLLILPITDKDTEQGEYFVFCASFFLLLSIACFFAWREITATGYKKSLAQYNANS